MAVVRNNVYTKGTYTLTLVFNNNGGGTVPANASNNTKSAAQSVKVTTQIPSTVPTRSGFQFLGYATSANGDVEYQPGNSISHWFSRSATLDHVDTVQDDGTTYATYYYNTSNKGKTNTYYAKWKANISTISASNGTLGTAQTITITRNDAIYVHDLTYSFAGQTGTIATNVATSYSWTPALTLAEAIPSAVSGTCTITCATKDSGGTVLGSTSITITLSVPSTVKAAIASVTLAETVAGLNSQFAAYVQNKSKIKVTGSFNRGNGSPAYGATIASISTAINGQTLTGNEKITGLLSTSGSNNYTMTITDSRGRTATKTGSFTVQAYNAPTISATAQRDANTLTTIGVSYSWNISSVNSRNTKSIRIRYRVAGSSATPTVKTTITPTAYSGSSTYNITGLDADTGYEIFVDAIDYFGTVTVTSSVAGNANRIYHVSHTDKTIARHGANPADGWDHQFFNERYHGVVDVVNRRCEATIPANSAGWYRVFDYSALNEVRVSGDPTFSIDITILESARQYHKITLYGILGALKFGDETSVTHASYVDKIRYVKDGTHGYIDVYYTGSGVSRHLACYFDVKGNYTNMLDSFTSLTPSLTVNSPVSPATVLTEYTFAANTNVDEAATKDENFSASTFAMNGYRRGDILIYSWNIRVPALTAATWYNMGTFSKVIVPATQHVTWAGQSNAHYLIEFQTSGNVRIYSANEASAQFCRGKIVVPAN